MVRQYNLLSPFGKPAPSKPVPPPPLPLRLTKAAAAAAAAAAQQRRRLPTLTQYPRPLAPYLPLAAPSAMYLISRVHLYLLPTLTLCY